MLRTPSAAGIRRAVTTITFLAAAAGTAQSCQQYQSTHLAAAAAPAPGGLDIPADYLAAYQANGSMCSGLSWQVLAGIGFVETNHGRSPLPGIHSSSNGAGASGPMQFISATWREERRRHPDIGPDVYNINDAATAAAHLLCESGVGRDARSAIYNGYNHDWGYVSNVMAKAREYGL